MSDDDFLAAFEACTLTRPEWTHEAHLRMGWLYAGRLRLADAIERAQVGIRRLNNTFIQAIIREAQGRDGGGPVETPPDGYHDTITVAFMRVIASRCRAGETFHTFRSRNSDLFDRTLPALLVHYSREQLYSPEAKARFVEPDLLPLPG
jgi:hypothetical protein